MINDDSGPIKKFKTDLFVGNFSNHNYEHIFSLNDKAVINIKIGEAVTEEIFEFSLLEFLTNNPMIKNKIINLKNSNFLILMDKFLFHNFIKYETEDEDLQYLKVYI